MKPSTITATLGAALIVLGVILLIESFTHTHMIPIFVGGALLFLALKGGRVGTLVFGHSCIVLGAYLITWGLLLLPYSKPEPAYIFGRPLFWGIFSLMGGVCAIFHGFCRCVMKQVDQFEGNQRVAASHCAAGASGHRPNAASK
jgi:membrane-bound ClpP family serine protease